MAAPVAWEQWGAIDAGEWAMEGVLSSWEPGASDYL